MCSIISNNPTWSIGIVITLFVVLATHRLTINRNRKERHDTIYTAFYNSFVPAIQILTKEAGTFTQQDFISFQNMFTDQESHMHKLRDILNKGQLNSFNTSWSEYVNLKKLCDTYENYVMIIGLESNRKKIVHLINTICEKAKYK